MAIDTDIVARKYLAPATGATISVDIPATDKTTIKVYLSEVGDVAVQDTDYTVTLNTSTYEDFTITPTASLRTKLDALVTAGGTDFIVVRRTLGYLSDMTAELAFFRQKIAQEFDKTIMRFQQIAEKVGRCISRSENDTGATGSLVLPFSGGLANKALVFDADENLTVSVDDYDDQAANAAVSAAAALASQNAAASSASAASTSAGNAHTSELNAAASAAAAALNVVSAEMGPVCSAATLAAGRTALGVYDKATVDLKAPLANPIFSGQVSVPTPTTFSDATTKGYADALSFPNNFRLSLTSGVAVTTSDVTGATTLYCTPYNGNKIALWTASGWVNRNSNEFSIALGTLTNGLPYDVFCYDNAGTPTLELLAWTNSTTRATALTYQDGVLVKAGAATRRYLGTFYTTATTTTEDSVNNRYLWNYYNRVRRPMLKYETTASWTYTTGVWRQANGNSANLVNFVVGVSEDTVNLRFNGNSRNSTGGVGMSMAIGINNVTSPSAQAQTYTTSPSAGTTTHFASFSDYFPIGKNYVALLEYSNAVGTTTWGVGYNESIGGEIFA